MQEYNLRQLKFSKISRLYSEYKFIGTTLLLGLSLIACTPPSPKDKSDRALSTATFFSEKSSISSVKTVYSQQTGLAQARVYSLEVCLKDNVLLKSLENIKVQILKEGHETISSTMTDANGCLRWEEKIGFNYLAKGQWLTLTRSVKATGIHVGSRSIKFAINPWEDKSESLQSKEISDLVSESGTLEALKGPSVAQLILDDLKVSINEKVVGKILSLDLKTIPQIHLQRGGTKFQQEVLPSGEFLMDLKLYALTGAFQKTKIDIGGAEKVPLKIQNGILLTHQAIDFELKELCQNGIVELELKLIAQSPELKSLMFEGIYNNLGDCDQIKGGFFAKLKFSPQLASIPASNNSLAPTAVQGGVAGFTQRSLDLSKEKDAKNQLAGNIIINNPLPPATLIGYIGDAKSRQRTKVFSLTACLIRPLDRKPLALQDIEIKKINGKIETLKTQLSGCLTWDDSISFDQFDSECWTKKSFTLSSRDLHFNETLSVDINPLDDGPGSIRDSRRGMPETQCTSSQLQLLAQSYDFDLSAEGIQYAIDQFLNIRMQKTGILKIPLRLIKSSLKNSEARIEIPAPAGKYRLRWAIIDGRIKDFQAPIEKFAGTIYQAHEMIVDIQGSGTVSEKIQLEHAETKSIGNLNTILFEIEPTESQANFTPITFAGSILLSDRKEPGSLEPVQSGKSLIKPLLQRYREDLKKNQENLLKMSQPTYAAQEKGAQLVHFTQKESLNLFLQNLSTPTLWKNPHDSTLSKASPYSLEKITQWIQTGKSDLDLEDRLCAIIFLNKLSQKYPQAQKTFSDLYKKCKKAQESQKKWLQIDYLYFVKNIEQLGQFEFTNEIKALGNGFMMVYSKDKSDTFSVDVNGGLNTGKRIGEWIGKIIPKIAEWVSPLSVGGGARYQWAWADREASGNASANQSMKQLLIEKLPFSLRTTEYEKCSMVRLAKSELTEAINLVFKELKKDIFIPDMFQPIMVCDGKTIKKEKNFRELYAVLNQLTYGAQITNLNSSNARSFFMMIRGAKDFDRLMEEISMSMSKPDNSGLDFSIKNTIDSQFKQIFDSPTRSLPGVFIDSQ